MRRGWEHERILEVKGGTDVAVVSIPGREPLSLRNQTLRELCARARQLLANAEDRYHLDQAAGGAGPAS